MRNFLPEKEKMLLSTMLTRYHTGLILLRNKPDLSVVIRATDCLGLLIYFE